jgi:hypothetical protein
MLVNGTTYNDAAPEVIRILEDSRATKRRLLIFYGDVKTGRRWGDQLRGHIGRSMGPVCIPIMLCTRRSVGGEGLLEQHIVEIRESKGGRVIYRCKPTAGTTATL